MALRSSSMFFLFIFLLASCLVQITQEAAAADCRLTGHRYCFSAEGAAVNSLETLNRKVVAGFKKKKLNEKAAAISNANNGVGWELRKVPSGPDPLHHNGNTPKKPRTDP